MAEYVLNPIRTLERVLGNRETIKAALTDQNGTAIDLTGATVAFRMVLDSDSTVKVSDAAATVDTASSGYVSYTPTAADMDTVGVYDMFWLVTPSSGQIQRYPYDGARWKLNLKTEVTEN